MKKEPCSQNFSFLLIILVLVFFNTQFIQAEVNTYISTQKNKGNFTLSSSGSSAPLYISSQDYPGVLRVLKLFQSDLNRVTGKKPELYIDQIPRSKQVVIVGTLGKSPLIEELIGNKKLDIKNLTGKWETFLIQAIDNPFAGVDRALVITGSDKRGTIYGLFDLSEKIGVSPWYWWADVPIKKKSELYVIPGQHTAGEPKVRYRGIFINDEAPALSGWAYEKFGGFNSKFYDHVFELILRLKGNFLWPAMWGRAFYVDDPENPRLADEYGIVISTSHHEPMMRAHAEWAQFGSGPWNYETNEANLREFWTEGIRRMNDYESIVTLAMRGDGDEPMTEEANIDLLQKIVRDQRDILAKVTDKDITTIPQVWALYKEVQEYYDRGMRVTDDITLLLCDDNWGNIRRLPYLNKKQRDGGYGIYYHYDYVGGPRNYKWLNTNQISRVWEQMHLAYEYGANRIWIVNVGDIKPMEFPIHFFLDYAWNPEEWAAERLPEYTRLWVEQQFGPEYADQIAEILCQYMRFNSRRKPELLSPDTYSLINFREAETILSDYIQLLEKATQIYNSIPREYRDSFYQLVLHPVEACSNLNELYVTVGKNYLYAKQKRAITNNLAEKARQLFKRDAEITYYYNHELANGKWNHIMDQTHIGYTYWQQPEENTMPEVIEIEIPEAAEMGVFVEGSESWWPENKTEFVLPEFDPFNRQSYYIELFNLGGTPFEYAIGKDQPWLVVENEKGIIEEEERIWVSVDWEKVTIGKQSVLITIAGPYGSVAKVRAVVNNPALSGQDIESRFIESNGHVAIEAEHYTRVVNTHPVTWQRIPDLGRTFSAMTPFPVTIPTQTPAGDSPRLEYRMYLFSKGEVTVKAFLSPTLNFHNTQGLRYGISFDNEVPQIVNMHENRTFQDWEESVRNNITLAVSKHVIKEPGRHVLKYWVVDPGVVLQKLVVETGEEKKSYLGPPESYFGEVVPEHVE